MRTSIKTLADLKEFLNTLNESQLQQVIQYWGESQSGQIDSVFVLEEDYINPSGEGCEPISAYTSDPYYKDDDMQDEIVHRKDTVILEVL